jgi:formate dehydrogenase major subunit
MDDTVPVLLTIDGHECPAHAGQTLLEVARAHGIEIPTLCHDPRLPAYGSCLLCVVEIEGIAKLMLACATEAKPGAVVHTRNARVDAARKYALDMLVSNHYADCRGPCYVSCPADVDVQGYLALANAGKYGEALAIVRQTNPFPSVCGRVCVRYCEASCRRNAVDAPVAVNFIKRYIADLEGRNLPPVVPPPANGHRVAVVGGGPAGLTAAYNLARRGCHVRIYERHPKLGGMLRYGIPDYRLPQHVLDEEVRQVLGYGIEVRTDVALGEDFTLDGLQDEGFEAVLLALGACDPKPMKVKNERTPGVVGGVHFLERVKKEGAPDLRGHVVVVGGGNTAVDAARTALRCNASKVTIVYRRTRQEMPADHVEIEDALAEGVEIQYLVAPLEVIAENGRVKALRCQRMELGEPDESGRRRPVPVNGSEQDVLCNTIISAIGQDINLAGAESQGGSKLAATSWNTLVVDQKTYETSLRGVFAAGDIVSGPAAAVDAIGAGLKAAQSIYKYLKTGRAVAPPDEFLSRKTDLSDLPADFFAAVAKTERAIMIQTPPEERVRNFEEVDHGIAAAQVRAETSRCLSCGCSAVFTCDLKKYAGEYHADQARLKGRVKKYKVDARHPYIELDPNKCILCGKCVRLCGDLITISALGFVQRGFDTVVRPSMERGLRETTCISCGNCIEVCPTGAIDYRMPYEKPGPWRTEPHESVCGYCGVGCRIVYNKQDDDIWHVTARRIDAFTPGDVCVRGRFGHRFRVENARVKAPRVRQAGLQRPGTLPLAITKAVEGLRDVASRHGADSLAFFVSPKASNEVVYLVQALAREGFGTNNVASFFGLERTGGETDLAQAFGLASSTLPASDVEHADVIVTVNAEVTVENPVLGFHIKRGVRRGAELVSISATETAVAEFATMRLAARRGTNTVLLHAVAHEIVKAKRHDRHFVGARTEGFDAFATAIEVDTAEVERVTGVERHRIEELARLVSGPGTNVCFVYDADASFEKSPRDLQAIANLLLLTGKVGRPSNGLILARRHANGQGLLDLGGSPDAVNAQAAGLRGARTLGDLRQAVDEGGIRGVFIYGENPARHEKYAPLFANAEFVVTMDMFETETSRASAVVLPGSGYSESEGSVTSMDRRVQAFVRAFQPPAGRTGLEILAHVFRAATGTATVPGLQEVRERIAAFNPRYAAIRAAGVSGSFTWNEAAGGHVLFASRFATPSGRGRLQVTPEAPRAYPRKTYSFSTIDAFFEAEHRRRLAVPVVEVGRVRAPA